MHAINAIISEQLNSPDTFTTDLIQIKAMSTESPLTKNGEIRTPSKPNCTPNDEDTKTQDQAIENATALADASYSPPQSLLNSPSPHPLIWSVDGVSLRNYNRTPSIFTARAVPVPLRGKLKIPIHITAGGSLVEYTVESKDFDVSFGIVAEREEGSTVVAENSRVDSHISAINGKFVVGSVPCALIFTFDNEYSWFREKFVTYKVNVIPPTKESVALGRKVRAKSALKIVTKDKAGADLRLGQISTKKTKLVEGITRLEKELEEKKKSLGVVQKEQSWLSSRVDLRLVQENLLNKRLEEGWDDEKSIDLNCSESEVSIDDDRAEV